MKIHKVYSNVRSPEQWEIISRNIDFKDKTVLDLGCGRGDILSYAFGAGANVTGIDNDKANVEYISSVYPEVGIIEGDLDNLSDECNELHQDIIICFSVLPYLKIPDDALEWIRKHSSTAFIECQYSEDGPGFDFLKSNDEMAYWLLDIGSFKTAKAIGHTLVEGRDKKRYIWMCG